MAGETTPSLFVTANVGSIFEEPTSMLKTWAEEFLATVAKLKPKFVALHCQEVGGKKYEASMKHVQDFVQLLLTSEELKFFDKAQIYLDEDFSSTENFTALGNFYLIHESVTDVMVFDFEAMDFIAVDGKNIHSGNIEDITTKEKSKFPQELFPECKWARKGFMRTRWKLNGTVFDLINIHLFHDASNFVAMETFPSIYCQNRKRALEHTLERFHTDRFGGVPYIVFGDFNFRTDTQGVVKKLSKGLHPVRVHSNKSTEHTKVQYTDESSQVILTLGKKEFSHLDHQKMFTENVSDWLKELDREYEPFSQELFEFGITFPPTYPYVEDNNGGECYMQTRCPSWCDRVLLSCSAKSLVNNIEEEGSVEYGLIGKNSCMGDHKPVFLRADLKGGQGTVSCTPLVLTSHLAEPCLYALNRLPSLPGPPLARSRSHYPRNRDMATSAAAAAVSSTSSQKDGLTVPPFQHHNSPYTPDSTDTEPDSLPASAERVSPHELATSLQHTAAERKRSSLQSAREPRRKSASKIPVREANTAPTLAGSPSKIPVLKSKRKTESSNSSPRRPQVQSILPEADGVAAKNTPRLVLSVDPACSDEDDDDPCQDSAGESPTADISFMDSLSPTQVRGSESDSVTDSGFSVSPALSGAVSPSADSSEKSCPSMDPKSDEVSEAVTTMPPMTAERFALVRRIQSASAMERKSSFPLHSSSGGRSPESLGGRLGMRNRCFSDSAWKERPSSRALLTKSQSQIRVISMTSNLEKPLPRLQSHHSSSEEDWFEMINPEESDTEPEARSQLVRQKRLSTHDEHESSVENVGSESSREAPEEATAATVPVAPEASLSQTHNETPARLDEKLRKKSKCKACCTLT